MYSVLAYTNIGKKRTNNEDRVLVNGQIVEESSYFFSRFHDVDHNIFVVADGMGGLEHGEVASQMVVDFFTQTSLSFDDRSISHALDALNRQVFKFSELNLDNQTIGSTLVGCLTQGKEAILFNVGDSLAYSFDKDVITLLSLPHNTNTYNAFRDNPNQFMSPGLLEFIGNRFPNRYFSYNVLFRKLNLGEVIFLSSDGVTNYFPQIEDLAAIFSKEQELQVYGETIVDIVMNRGAGDNFSFIIIKKVS